MIVIGRKTFTVLVCTLAAGAAAAVLMCYMPRATFGGNHLKVVVDAGHGSPDGGAVGAAGTLEKDVNLAIADAVREVLEGKGISVVMTRVSDDGLWETDGSIRQKKREDMNRRLEIVRDSGADLFLSIHMNAFEDDSANGLHIFYAKNHPEGEELAAKIQEGIAAVTKAETHAVKAADESLFLMKSPPMTAVLAECGFLSNPEEEQKLIDPDYQKRIAWAIASGIEDYYNDMRT